MFPASPFLAIRNGHASPSFHPLAYFDALGAGVPTPGLYDYLRAGDAKYMILSSCLTFGEYAIMVGRDLDRLYAFSEHLPDPARDIHMWTGFDCSALDVYRRRADVTAPIRAAAEDPPPRGSTAEPLRAAAIASGGAFPEAGHVCVLTGGDVVCWGANGLGQVAPAVTAGSVARPRLVLRGATQVTAGGMHTCALRAEEALCWGDNRDGALGDGTNLPSAEPVRVRAARPLRAIAAGAHHTCAIDSAKAVICWGANTSGQLGSGGREPWAPPRRLAGVVRAVELALGVEHSCARNENGAVSCWGTVPGIGEPTLSPRTIAFPLPARAIAAGADETCAILTDGRVACFGLGHHADLGDGSSYGPASAPVVVPGVAEALALSLGRDHACAVAKGGVFCWGANEFAESAAASTPWDVTRPEHFVALDGTTELALGQEHGCGLSRDGVATCWGGNDRGQLGSDDVGIFGRHAPRSVDWLREVALPGAAGALREP